MIEERYRISCGSLILSDVCDFTPLIRPYFWGGRLTSHENRNMQVSPPIPVALESGACGSPSLNVGRSAK